MTTPSTAILLVDDVEANLLALVALLRQDGLALHTARSGRDALELLLRHDYALALIDVHMPEIDGFELAELMRGAPRTRGVPIIFLTANPHEPQRLFQGYEAGAVDFLIKPIEPRVLSRKVSTFLELDQQKRLLRDQLADRERLAGELTEALRLSETFVAALGHDLRNPLNAVTFGLSVLERQPGDPVSRRVIGRMRSATSRMTAILDQLHDLARVRLGGGLDLQLGPTDLIELTREVVHEHRTARPDARIAFHGAGEGAGLWDRVRLARVASNLIGNALQHGEPGGEVRVEIDGTRPGALRLAVWNRGSVPDGARPHLFEPFRRGPHSGVTGLGLGLYIVQQIVEAHGGRVTFDSDPHHGTRFCVEVPRRAGPADPADPRPPSAPTRAAAALHLKE